MASKKIPITRVNKFFSEEDFNLNKSIGMEYLHGNLNFTLVYYGVDRKKTVNDDVYGESEKDDIRFFPPVEFKAYVSVADSSPESYASGILKYEEPGNLTFHVYIDHLKELDIDIHYGDYIGYPEREDRVRYYTVANDGQVVSANKHTILGYKPFYRTII